MHESSQTGLVATKRQEKFKSKQYSLVIDDPTLLLWKLWKLQLFVSDVSNLCQDVSTFFVYIFRNCWKLKNVRSSIPSKCYTKDTFTKFHGNRLVRFRDILHTVSKNLVSSRKTRLKFQNVTIHMYHLLTFFTYISPLTVLTIHN